MAVLARRLGPLASTVAGLPLVLMRNGLITRKVAMMPLIKVTDMSSARPPAGRVLGYGEIVIESAGHDQALRKITYLPDSDGLYLKIAELPFGPRSVSPGAWPR